MSSFRFVANLEEGAEISRLVPASQVPHLPSSGLPTSLGHLLYDQPATFSPPLSAGGSAFTALKVFSVPLIF